MHRSCYGDILPDKGKENGNTINLEGGGSSSFKKELINSVDNSLHQQVDPVGIFKIILG